MALFLLVAILFPLVPIMLARWLAPQKPSKIKESTYECGMASEKDSWIQFRIQFYIFALLFVIFDIEAVFLIPCALAFPEFGFPGFLFMALFILLLAESWAYAWIKNALEWE
ncbi:MAG: NADH-quinone oxidoreductase subunit A [Candidatus Omnitrophota bacterium]